MVRIIVLSRKAYSDIERIVEFNNVRNKTQIYSAKFVKALQKHLKTLSKQAFIGRGTDMAGVLVFAWDNYYIFYSVSEHVITVQAIYHQREDIL